jgi:hypothetical protein
LQPFLVKSVFDQVPNKGFALLAANLGSGVPRLMAADKPITTFLINKPKDDSYEFSFQNTGLVIITVT